jgi:N-acetyltransferase
VDGVCSQGWQGERVVWSCPQSQQRILLVTAEDAPVQWRRTKDAAALVATQLGLATGWLLSVPAKVFLCVGSNKKLLGCCVSEELAWAHRTVLEEPSAATGDDGAQRTDSCGGASVRRREQAAVPAMCGIRAVWVHRCARRQGLATRLLDAVRCVPPLECVRVCVGWIANTVICFFCPHVVPADDWCSDDGIGSYHGAEEALWGMP